MDIHIPGTDAVTEALQVTERTSLADAASNRLRSAILNGVIAPGEPLVEAHLAQIMGISRAPLREAVLRLQLEGLAVQVHNKGARVATVTKSDVCEIYDMRSILEGHAARIIAEQKSRHLVKELREQVATKLKPSRKPIDLFEADLKFHETVCTLANNQRLLQQWKVLSNQALLCYSLTNMENLLTNEEYRSGLQAVHIDLVDCLTQSPNVAESAFRKHAADARDRLVETLEQNGQRSTAECSGRLP